MQKKLRIAIVCDAIDDATLGWSFISGKRFGAWLAKVGHDIVWITSKFKDTSKKKEFEYATVYEFPHLPAIGAYGVRFAYTSVARLKKIFQKEKIDVVYSIQPTILAWQAVRAAKRLHIPIISHSHTLPELFVPWAPHFIQKLIKKFVAYMYKKYDGLMYPTEFLKKKYADCHFTKPEAVIGNWVDTAIFHPGEKSTQNKFNLLYVGRLDPEKNLNIVLDALHILRSQKKLGEYIHCTFVWGWSLEKKLHHTAKEYWLWDIVEFTWRMYNDWDRLVKIYQEASVFVLPSRYETEWMVVLEAMACGCPLLISDSPTSAAKDFVHNNGYTFDYKDPQDLADKIYSLSTNPELCKIMRNISLEQAQNFSFTLSVQKLESFLLSFVGK